MRGETNGWELADERMTDLLRFAAAAERIFLSLFCLCALSFFLSFQSWILFGFFPGLAAWLAGTMIHSNWLGCLCVCVFAKEISSSSLSRSARRLQTAKLISERLSCYYYKLLHFMLSFLNWKKIKRAVQDESIAAAVERNREREVQEDLTLISTCFSVWRWRWWEWCTSSLYLDLFSLQHFLV